MVSSQRRTGQQSLHDKYRHIITTITLITVVTIITFITLITIITIIILTNSEVYAMGWHVTWGGRLLQRATRATQLARGWQGQFASITERHLKYKM